jgi:hypothetical protein
MKTSDAMLKYIRSIRNANKKDYATRYAIWLARGEDAVDVTEPVPFHLSYMGAQSVRMALYAIQRQEAVKWIGVSED